MTETTSGLALALSKVQSDLPKLERDRTVTVKQKSGDTYSYSYVTLANLSEAVLPMLAKHGLAFAAMPGAGSDGKMCLRYALLHESGERLEGEFPISGEGGIQMVGGRITYARRYVLAALVGVSADEDDESRLDSGSAGSAQRATRPRAEAAPVRTAARKPPSAPAGGPPLPGEGPAPQAEGQRKAMHAEFKRVGIESHDARVEFAGRVLGRPVESTSDLTFEETSNVIDWLKRGPSKDQPADNPQWDAPALDGEGGE